MTERARRGRNYATILIPEGLLLAIPDVRVLLREIDAVFRESSKAELTVEEVAASLTTWSAALLSSMPAYIQVANIASDAKVHYMLCTLQQIIDVPYQCGGHTGPDDQGAAERLPCAALRHRERAATGSLRGAGAGAAQGPGHLQGLL